MHKRAEYTDKASDFAQQARSNPYVQRLLTDEELRSNVRDAVRAARNAYGMAQKDHSPKHLAEDKKLHRELREAAASLRDAADQFRGKAQPKKSHAGRKVLGLGILAAGAVLILNEDVRKSVLDRLFGAEEEFEYTSTTAAGDGAAAADVSA